MKTYVSKETYELIDATVHAIRNEIKAGNDDPELKRKLMRLLVDIEGFEPKKVFQPTWQPDGAA